MSNPDLSHLLSRPVGEAKEPPTLPAGEGYIGMITKYEFGQTRYDPPTDVVRFFVKLMKFPEHFTADMVEGIVLETRQMTKEYDVAEDQLYKVDAMLKAFGDFSGQSYSAVFPQLVGKYVNVEVQQKLNQKNNKLYANIGKLSAAE